MRSGSRWPTGGSGLDHRLPRVATKRLRHRCDRQRRWRQRLHRSASGLVSAELSPGRRGSCGRPPVRLRGRRPWRPAGSAPASIISSIGVERSSCSSLAARETAAAATARLRARYVVPCLSSARHSPSAVPVTVRVSSSVLVFLPAALLAGAFFGVSSAEASAAGASGAGVHSQRGALDGDESRRRECRSRWTELLLPECLQSSLRRTPSRISPAVSGLAIQRQLEHMFDLESQPPTVVGPVTPCMTTGARGWSRRVSRLPS